MNYRLFIFNLVAVLLLLVASSYYLFFYYIATVSNLLLPFDHLAYALWVFVFVMTVGTGIEVIKGFWEATAEEIDPVAEAVGPILLEGGI